MLNPTKLLSCKPFRRAHACNRQLRPVTGHPVELHRRRRTVAIASGDGLPGSIQSVIAELRADPTLGPVFDSPRLQKALQELREDPAAALAKYANDKQIMAIMTRLAQIGLRETEGASKVLSSLNTDARDAAVSVFSDGQLAARLAAPRIRTALAEIRANPEAGMAKYENDREVMEVLDMLQSKLERQGKVIDV